MNSASADAREGVRRSDFDLTEFAVAALLASVSALFYGLTFPPTGWYAIQWVVLVPFLLAIRKGGWRQALFITWLWCVVGASVAGDCFPRAIAEYFHQPMLLALAMYAGIFTFMAAPYFMVFAVVYRRLSLRFEALLPFLTASAWVGAELGRGRLMTGTPFFIGNPWGLVGYAQADVLPLVQIASATGIYGVSFVVVCVNAALVELWIARHDPVRRMVPASRSLCLAAVLALFAWGFGVSVMPARDDLDSDPDAVAVAIVQGNIESDSRWRADMYGRNLDTYLGLTAELGSGERPEIVYWPESEPLYQAAIARLLGPLDLELAVGGPRVTASPTPDYFNSTFVLGVDGRVSARYDKEYLVPFAEYFPIGVDVMRRRFGRVRYFQHGTQTAPLPTRAGLAGVLVCNEVMLPEVAAIRVADGAEYLLNPSNDSWIDDEQYSEEQLDIARMRAVELRRYLVRASTSGPSAIIDPYGRVQVRSANRERAVLRGWIRARNDKSIYAVWGDWFGLSCLVVALSAALARGGRVA